MIIGHIKKIRRNLREHAFGAFSETRRDTMSRTPDFFIHESSFADPSAQIGEGTKIWHFCNVMKDSKIGKNCILGQNVHVGPKVSIGNGVKIQNNVSLYEGVVLEDDVFCGPSMVFTNVMNPRSHVSRKHEFKKTLVKKGATIGANATIVCGNTLGEYSFIGAGAVIIKDVPAYALMVGNPARQIGWMCSCGVKLPKNLKCSECGSGFKESAQGLELLK